jgi:acetyl esterase/lipase
MTYSGASITENASNDVVLPAERATETAQMYLAGAAPKSPQSSPLFADFTGACPVFLCVGDTEILRDDTVRMVQKLKDHGVRVSHHLEQDLPHVWPIFHNFLPEAKTTLRDVSDWIRQVLSEASGS